MLKNYLLTAWRGLIRNKEYALINVFGLSISIASCLILFYILHYELSFDTFHTNRKQLYRAVTETDYPEGKDHTAGTPQPFPDALRVDFPQIKNVAVIVSRRGSQIDLLDDQPAGEKRFKEDRGVFFTEPAFFNMFDFKWLMGTPEQALQKPNAVVLSREMAEKYFGDWKQAIGKTIQYENKYLLKVTGILEDVPVNTDFPLKVVGSLKTFPDPNTDWGSISSTWQCYIQLDEQTSAAQIEAMFPAFEKKHQPQGEDIQDHYKLQPLEDIHFNSDYGTFNGRTVSKSTLLSLGLAGIFLLITASINFVNLAVAQIIRRSKEVGVRKVLGSNRIQLSLQFLGETFLILLTASALSVVLVQIALPLLRPFLTLPSSFNPMKPLETAVVLIVISVVITVLSAIYPVHVMTAFKPVQALKSKISMHTMGGVPLQKSLLIVQFVIAQILVITTLIVVQQLDFFRKAPLGFDKNAVMILPMPDDSLSQAKIESLRNALLQEAGVKSVSFSFAPPLSTWNWNRSFHFDGSDQYAPFEANMKYADADYFKTYGLSLAAGRIYQHSDTAREYVVSKTLVQKLGFHDPEDALGKKITIDDMAFPIVGVVNDFHIHSLREKIEPMILASSKENYHHIGVKLETTHVQQAVEQISSIYATIFPNNIFEYRFLDENIQKQYAEEERLAAFTNIFSGIAIFISCLGLYGLISFMAVQRTKEVGVRKVLGANITDVVMLFYKEFIFLVIIAFAIAAPVGWYIMSDWLAGFAYRIDLNVWTFLIAVALSLVISLATVSFRSIKAALVNPVKSLRSE